jgi:NHLM bacteriocin system ABC transporter ATP-binding protein
MNNDFENQIIKRSTPQEVSSGGRFNLDDTNYIWYVQSGAVDIFVTEIPSESKAEKSTLHFLARINAEDIFLAPNQVFRKFHYKLICRVCSNTAVFKFEKSRIYDLDKFNLNILSNKIDVFIAEITKDNIKVNFPKVVTDISSINECTFQEGQNVVTYKHIRWFTNPDSDCYFINDSGFTIEKGDFYLPVTPYSWFEFSQHSNSFIYSTADIISNDLLWKSIDTYYLLILRLKLIHIENEGLFYNVRLYNKVESNQEAINQSNLLLTESYTNIYIKYISYDTKTSPAYATYSMVCNYLDIPLKPLNQKRFNLNPIDFFKKTMMISKLFYREVELKAKWYEQNHGPLITFRRDNDNPIAIIPDVYGNYFYYNQGILSKTKMTEALSNEISPIGFCVYPKIETENIKVANLVQPVFKQSFSELLVVLLCVSCVSILSLSTPLLTQYIFDEIILTGDKNELLQISLILFSIIFSVFGFEITRNYLILNFENRLDFFIQGTFIDRLLRLPINFFKIMSAGEFVSRLGNLHTIRMLTAGVTVSLVFEVIFLITNFTLLFYYHAGIASIIFLIAILLFTLNAFLLIKRSYYENDIAAMQARLFGTITELFSSITKIRLAGAEYRAFLHWSKAFAKLQALSNIFNQYIIFQRVILNSMPLLLVLCMYISISLYTHSLGLSTGKFIAFNIVLGQIVVILYQFMEELSKIISISILYKKSKVFIKEKPEVAQGSIDPGVLKGEIELVNVSFKYPNAVSQTLSNLSFSIAPGEYVALVGRSGMGKSTLIRLLLGFDVPTSGRIYYDSKDLMTIDADLLRQQLGVVLQNDALTPGTIYDNISGTSNLTIDKAWEIIENVGLLDDILDMPMQMNTMINLNGEGLSGGQKQRILIARAIARNPKILILDEATRSLDNITQRVVIDYLSKIRTTRIVIAHRLSTLAQVDRIIVIENGTITEVGTYKELISKKGTFYNLVQKQIM